MKKKDIIELLQNKEAVAYLDLQQYNDNFGADHRYTTLSRRTWGVLVEIMAEMQIKAYRKQYNLNNFFVVRPCNVYGPGDNFDPENAMVIPTLMNRIFNKEDPVIIWGDGSAVRDFAYAGDVADGIILAIVKGTGNFDFLNLGSGNGYTIKKLVETLSEVVNFNYRFDKKKDSGFPKRIMDISNAKKILGYSPKISLKEGLKETWSWYINNSNQNKKRHNYFK